MHDAAVVDELERGGELAQDALGLDLGERSVAREEIAQRRALAELHHDELGPERREVTLHARDVVVLQVLDDPGLALESRGRAGLVDQTVAHHLERDPLAGRKLRRFVDDRHASSRDRAEHAVAVQDLALQPVVKRAAEAIGDEIREDDRQLGVLSREGVELSRRTGRARGSRWSRRRRRSRAPG